MPQSELPRSFMMIWAGHLVSSLGSGLTYFALGIWVYQRTGSAAAFTSIVLAAALPGILLLPFAGAFVDRWNRRTVLIATQLGSGLCIATMFALLRFDTLQVWQICILSAIGASCGAFEWPALSVASTVLVPKEQLGRANGMIQLAQGSAFVVSPLLAGLLLPLVHLEGLLLADVVTYAFAMTVLITTRFSSGPTAVDPTVPKSLLREMRDGWRYIAAWPGLFWLVMLFAAINFPLNVAQVLLTPLVLSFSTSAALGSVVAAYGTALLAGGILISIRGIPTARVKSILWVILVQAGALIVCGMHASALLVGATMFVLALGIPLQTSANQALWQVKVPLPIQGRTFAVRRMIGQLSVPVAYFAAGRLADHYFEPLLVANGPLASTVGRVIGVGHGRGTALLIILMGVMLLGILAVAAAAPVLRSTETEIPDAIEELAA
jgi:MFS family permease